MQFKLKANKIKAEIKVGDCLNMLKGYPDLPPKKWTQRRVGNSINTGLRMGVSNGGRKW